MNVGNYKIELEFTQNGTDRKGKVEVAGVEDEGDDTDEDAIPKISSTSLSVLELLGNRSNLTGKKF